jgi:predicted branched-subunit amino acid permease
MKTTSVQVVTARKGWQCGLVQGVPIVLGYVPIAFAYDVLAQKVVLAGTAVVTLGATCAGIEK